MIARNFLSFPSSGWHSHFDELDRMRSQLNRLMGDVDRGPFRQTGRGVYPLINLTEDQDNYYLRAELPGITKDDLELNVTDDNISISGSRKMKEEDEKATFHRRERDAGRFSRAITLPSKVDNSKIEAGLTYGILEVTLPKAEETKPKKIQVK